MIANSHDPIDVQDKRWKAVRLGLRLANSYLGAGLMGGFYILWVVIGLLLCFVLIPMAIMGKVDSFNHGMNRVAFYCFVVPMAVMAAATWAVKFFSRLLWCAIPEPMVATFLAFASVGGRLSVVIGALYLWLRGVPWGRGLLLPEVVACAGIAWLGLVADWVFIRTLRQEFIPAANSSDELDNEAENATQPERITEPPKESILKRNLGEWFKGRFPKSYKFVVWIVFPVVFRLTEITEVGG